jgi:hypothetical protein
VTLKNRSRSKIFCVMYLLTMDYHHTKLHQDISKKRDRIIIIIIIIIIIRAKSIAFPMTVSW